MTFLLWWFAASIGAAFINYALMQFIDYDDD
jgi:hypothetical protein